MAKKEYEQLTLSAKDATVQERQVTIRVLTIGTKQITQTLYRQLLSEQVIDRESGHLKGEVWGWVNLHGDCNESMRHVHVIWEDDGQLKCSKSYYPIAKVNSHWQDLDKVLGHLAVAYVCFVALLDKKFPGQDERYIYLTVKGRKIKAHIPSSVEEYWKLPEQIKYWTDAVVKNNGDDYCQRQLDYMPKHTEYIKNAIKEYVIDQCNRVGLDSDQYASHEQVYSEMERIAEQLNLLEQNWEQSFETIAESGQLFVAVSGVWK